MAVRANGPPHVEMIRVNPLFPRRRMKQQMDLGPTRSQYRVLIVRLQTSWQTAIEGRINKTIWRRSSLSFTAEPA